MVDLGHRVERVKWMALKQRHRALRRAYAGIAYAGLAQEHEQLPSEFMGQTISILDALNWPPILPYLWAAEVLHKGDIKVTWS